MIVVDASVMVNALVYPDSRGIRARRVLERDPAWCAPEHWRIEAFSAVRGLALGGRITGDEAQIAIDSFRSLGVASTPLSPLMRRMWQLRQTVSAYDAAYVSLAEERDLTLVTADAKLARAASTICRVELA